MRTRRVLLALAASILLPAAAAVALVTTEAGSRWLLQTAVRHAPTGDVVIHFGGVAGTLVGELALRDVRIATPAVEVRLAAAGIAWRPGALMSGLLHVESLTARGVRIRPLAPAAPAEPGAPPTLPDIALPLEVRLDRLRVEDATLVADGDVPPLDLLSLAARLDDHGLAVERLELRAAGATVSGAVTVATSAPHTVAGTLEATMPLAHPQANTLQARLTLGGEALRPVLALRTEAPAVTEVMAKIDLTVAGPRFAVDVTAGRVAWPPAGEPVVVAEDLRLSAEGIPDEFSVAAGAGVSGPGLPAVKLASLTATGSPRGLADIRARVEVLEGTVTATGAAGWAPVPRWDLDLTLEDLSPRPLAPEWPGSLSGRLSTGGEVAAAGPSATVTVERLAGRLRELPVAVAGTLGYGEGRASAELDLDVLAGEVGLAATLRPADAMAWEATVNLAEVDPAGLLPEWPGRLSGSLHGRGRLPATGPEAAIEVDRLAGSLRGQPVAATGTVDYRDGTVATTGFTLASGANRVELTGAAGARLDLGFRIDAPDLAAAYPGLAGAVHGNGRVQGTPSAPRIRGELGAEGVAYQDLAIQRLDLAGAWTEERADVRLEAADLRGAGRRLDRVATVIEGRPGDHGLSLDASGPDGSLHLGARGGIEGLRWSGTLTELAVENPAVGPWTLQGAAALDLAGDAVAVERLCLGRDPATLCLGGRWRRAGELGFAGDLRELPLDWLAPALPAGARLEGNLNGTFGVEGTIDAPQASVSLEPGDGRITVATNTDEPLVFAFSDARAQGRYGPAGGTASASLRLAEEGSVEARIRLDPGPDGTLAGSITAGFPNLAPVSGLVPALAQVEGRLDLDVAVGGTLGQPRLDGTLELADGHTTVAAAGLRLTDIRLAVNGDGNGPFTVNGGLRSGPGELTVEGTVDPLAAAGIGVDLAIRGTDFQAALLPQASVLVSPDLRFAGTGSYHLSGRLTVPQARIEVEQLPASAVEVSGDAVVVEEDTPVQEAEPVQRLTADVDIILGDDVRFEGFGLTTRLTGSLDATVNAKGPQVYGRIDLVDAAYKGYGQKLQVEQGRLLFNGPVENPTLDLKAVRESRDGRVKAYLAINSPVTKPRPRIYTEPALPDAEALAYLVTGRGLSQAGKQEGLDMAAMAFSLGIDRGEPLLQDISRQLGLDEIRVESGEGGIAESSVILGKYLNPDLYLGYSQGILDTVGEVTLKLRLTDQLQVETRSGTEQSVDLYYRLERD